jgi:hypothetical protein
LVSYFETLFLPLGLSYLTTPGIFFIYCWYFKVMLELSIISSSIITLITLYTICLLENLHLSQVISGIKLSEGKEILSIR